MNGMNVNGRQINRGTGGGLVSLLALIAAAIFFACLVFAQPISNWPLLAAGLFCVALALLLQRFNL